MVLYGATRVLLSALAGALLMLLAGAWRRRLRLAGLARDIGTLEPGLPHAHDTADGRLLLFIGDRNVARAHERATGRQALCWGLLGTGPADLTAAHDLLATMRSSRDRAEGTSRETLEQSCAQIEAIIARHSDAGDGAGPPPEAQARSGTERPT